jgi:hypothetical protein
LYVQFSYVAILYLLHLLIRDCCVAILYSLLPRCYTSALYIIMGEELNNSYCRLQQIDLDGLEDVEGCQARWLDEVQKKLNCPAEFDLKANKFAAPNKPVLAKWLEEASDIMCRQRDIMFNMKEMIELLKTEALGDKRNVIKLQGELLECKDRQLKSLQTAVESTVQATVQKEFQSYSDVLVAKNISAASGPVCTQEFLKKAVKTAIEEEDRSKNLMVFGFVEEDEENIEEKISDLFTDLGEKPRVTAVSRVGRRSSDGIRPVKVNFSSSTSAQQILSKARRLKDMEPRKTVYVCHDRSPEERAARREIVTELKKAAAAQPDRLHFIKGGKVCSREKS